MGELNEAPSADAVRDMASRLLRDVETFQSEIAKEDLPTAVRVRYLEKLAGVLVDLGKLTGATIINERMLLMSPGFKRVLNAQMDALTVPPDHEDAKCFAKALRRMADALEEAVKRGELK